MRADFKHCQLAQIIISLTNVALLKLYILKSCHLIISSGFWEKKQIKQIHIHPC